MLNKIMVVEGGGQKMMVAHCERGGLGKNDVILLAPCIINNLTLLAATC